MENLGCPAGSDRNDRYYFNISGLFYVYIYIYLPYIEQTRQAGKSLFLIGDTSSFIVVLPLLCNFSAG